MVRNKQFIPAKMRRTVIVFGLVVIVLVLLTGCDRNMNTMWPALEVEARSYLRASTRATRGRYSCASETIPRRRRAASWRCAWISLQ